jgi:acetyl-CoA carboxylase carboxyl transferase subunit alpha
MAATDAPFEAPLDELRRKIEELEAYPAESGRRKELDQMRGRLDKATAEIYRRLNRWETTLVARHSQRPHALDYIESLMSDWVELHGDRSHGEDAAVVAGFATFRGRSVAVVGHQKGRGTRERIRRNFGQPRPEGYRKALRVMKLAEKFGKPVVSLVDTPGAYPGVGAEERGQAEAIARNLLEMTQLRVPIVVVVTGEGGSGGALALGVGDRVCMLQYSIYSVISPEGCAAILWKDQEKRGEAAEALRLGAQDLLELGIIEEIIPEPLGAAHSDPAEMVRRVGDRIDSALGELERLSVEQLLEHRYRRFRALGTFVESS